MDRILDIERECGVKQYITKTAVCVIPVVPEFFEKVDQALSITKEHAKAEFESMGRLIPETLETELIRGPLMPEQLREFGLPSGEYDLVRFRALIIPKEDIDGR